MDFDKDGEFERHQREKRLRGRGMARRGGREEGGYDSLPAQQSGSLAAKSVEGWILFVSGVHEEANDEDMHDIFGEFGPVKNLHLNLDRRTCYVKGYALVEYEDLESAERAIQGVDGNELHEQILHVDWAFLKQPLSAK